LSGEGNLGSALKDLVLLEVGDQSGDYAAMLLAGLGVETIKLEPCTGSPARTIGPFASEGKHPEEQEERSARS
jgi:crotonobetainyl-CoA:carnitine CoA-transferase CaiB-like acyl-CoA transferase